MTSAYRQVKVLLIPGGGLIRLRESVSHLAESEARIADYVLQNPSEFLNLTVHELAKRSQSSPAAAVRLWKSLGFSGYQDFKLRVAGDIRLRATEDYGELKMGSSFEEIVGSIEETHVQSIQNTLRLLDESTIQEAVTAIVNAKRIMTFGVSASGFVADDLAQKLTRIGFPVHDTSDFHKAAVIASQLSEGDVFIVVSHSGTTSEVVEVAEIARRQGVHVIAICRFGDTPLSRLATTKLYTSAVEPQIRAAATTSRIAALTVIDLLFVYLAMQFHDEVYNALDVTRDVVKGHKNR